MKFKLFRGADPKRIEASVNEWATKTKIAKFITANLAVGEAPLEFAQTEDGKQKRVIQRVPVFVVGVWYE